MYVDDDDLADVMSEVVTGKAAYYALGRALRLPPGELNAVRVEHNSNLDMALDQVLLLWLQQKYKVGRFGPPTWKMLVEAVECRVGMNNPALAQNIALNHQQ